MYGKYKKFGNKKKTRMSATKKAYLAGVRAGKRSAFRKKKW